MFSLGPALATRTRAIASTPTLATAFARRTYPTTHGSDPKLDRGKRPATLIDHAPGWREDLATTSEASVKADRETTTMDEMQKKTVGYAHSQHRALEVERTHATYARDEVSGPLGHAGVGEFEGVVGSDDLGPDDTRVEVTTRVVHEKRTVGEGEPGAV